MNEVSFVLKTYESDIHEAIDCVNSIVKYCKSNFEVVIIADKQSELDTIKSGIFASESKIRFMTVAEIGVEIKNGYIDQQCIKLLSFQFTECNIIYFTDSDMIFWREFTIEEFATDNDLIIPFGDWGRNIFLNNDEVAKIQLHANQPYMMFEGQVRNYLSKLSPEELNALGFASFYHDKYVTVITRTNGSVCKWTSGFPDIMWVVSSRIFSAAPLNTMCSHYAVRRSTLIAMNEVVNERYGSIWRLAYERRACPVFSEYQLLGNFIVSRIFGNEISGYCPVPASLMNVLTTFADKMPYIKFNHGERPQELYNKLLDGAYSHVKSRRRLLAELPSGWG